MVRVLLVIQVPDASGQRMRGPEVLPSSSRACSRVAQGVSQSLILKKVPPVYPQQAKYARIQGSVVMSAVISKSGDVVDLEVLDGPIELAVSSVSGVRQWKYRPYVLNGEPVEVRTQITVNYVLSGV